MDVPTVLQRFLVADDYPGSAELFAQLVQWECGRAPCVVDIAHNGREAVDLATANRPRVAFIDIDMPVMGGTDAALAIRSLYASSPPLLIGITGGVTTFGKAVDSGAFDQVWNKPIDVDKLAAVIGG